MRAPYRNKFDADADFAVRKPFSMGGVDFKLRDPFDKSLVSVRRLRQMFDQRTLVYLGENPGAIMTPEEVAKTRRGQHMKRAERRLGPQSTRSSKAPPEKISGPEAIEAARRAVIIPDDWRTLPWPQRLKLAAQFTDEPVKNGPEAEAAVLKELAARGHS